MVGAGSILSSNKSSYCQIMLVVRNTIQKTLSPEEKNRLLNGSVTTFTNCTLCIDGEVIQHTNVIFSNDTGSIIDLSYATAGQLVDLEGAIVAPGFLELQTNGMRGFHFTHFEDKESYAQKIDEAAKYLPSTGVTGFYATIPTVHSDEFKKVRQDGDPTCRQIFTQ